MNVELGRFYDEYKPFRNFMRRLDLDTSLLDVWHYANYVMEDILLPDHYAVDRGAYRSSSVKSLIHPWELDVIAKEVILNAGSGGDRCLAKWIDLATAVNHVRRLDEVAFELSVDKERDVLIELHRLAHHQFPWQMALSVNPFMRAFKIYGTPEVDAIITRELGMTMSDLIRLGMAVAGGFRTRPVISTMQDYTVLGISAETSRAFFSRLSIDIRSLKEATQGRQSYDRDWRFSWNPLEGKPLIGVDAARPDLLVCPIPRHFLRRVTSGVYYDIVNAAGFQNPFGNSFQAYIGAVLEVACPQPPFSIVPEKPYYVGGNLHHGADWIVSDGGGHIFIECKTKRLRLDAKTRSDTKALEEDIAVLAKAIAQHYRNISEAVAGKTDWSPDGLPIYPLILTMEDWFIFSPQVDQMLNSEVKRLLCKDGLDLSLLDEMPFTIASAHEFEIGIQIIAEVGIAKVMAIKTRGEHRTWGLVAVLASAYSNEIKRVNWALFGDDLQRLVIPAGRIHL